MQATATQQAPPLPPVPVITVNGTPLALPGVPRTAQDVAALKASREELSNQLTPSLSPPDR